MALFSAVVVSCLIVGSLRLLLSTLRRLVARSSGRRRGRYRLGLIIVFNSSHLVILDQVMIKMNEIRTIILN